MNYKLHKAKPYILIALIDAFATQIYIDIFSNNFRISFAVLLLPVIYFFNRKLNPIVGALYIGFSGLFFRAAIGFSEYGGILPSLAADYQIFFFDISYGLIYYFFLYNKKDYNITTWLLVVFSGDLFANLVEVILRIGISNIAEFSDKIYILFYVALFRTIIAIMIVLIIQSYKMFILKSEHNQRYQKLLIRISDLESELYFINRNMEQIENVMFKAYDLYEDADELDRKHIKNNTLDIATDIHEIKKNYINIYNGIKEITDKDKTINELHVYDLMNMLFNNLNKMVASKDINIKLHLNNNYTVKESYYFLSIIRNILMNGIDALKESEQLEKTITMYEINSENHYIYKITDNGPGIDKEDISEIFIPGYSTKFHKESGDSNRGLGLFIVNELVENIYNGQVTVQSEKYKRTEFTIILPKEKLEVCE
ncbi:MAG: ATP-binding protein [Bacillota bacterium]|nr:ATP-binding protein [Bacillota bacterium]